MSDNAIAPQTIVFAEIVLCISPFKAPFDEEHIYLGVTKSMCSCSATLGALLFGRHSNGESPISRGTLGWGTHASLWGVIKWGTHLCRGSSDEGHICMRLLNGGTYLLSGSSNGGTHPQMGVHILKWRYTSSNGGTHPQIRVHISWYTATLWSYANK